MKRAIGGIVLAGIVAVTPARAAAPPFGAWVRSETQVSILRMLRNISPPDAVPGTVVASPSRQSPNYFFHWIRDSSLVMNQVVRLFAEAKGAEKAKYLTYLTDFVALALRFQREPGAEGLGEPRYRPDGTADTTPWARPQYDGPALRALTLIRFLGVLPLNSDDSLLRAQVLDVIRTDLAYVIESWRLPCYDLWEELRGLHFYSQSTQYAAMLAGAGLFRAEGDGAFGNRLSKEASNAQAELEKYWDESRGYIGASRNLEGKPDSPHYKEANLDTAVILAALHAQVGQGILSVKDGRVLATAHALEMAFAAAYGINQGAKAVAIGRFTDDVYYGGNPWYVTTAAFAELHYQVARTIAQMGITVTKNNLGFLNSALTAGRVPLLKYGECIAGSSARGRILSEALEHKGDGFLGVIREHAGSQGELAEQFDRDAGVPASAFDLTWSYAGFLSAATYRRARWEQRSSSWPNSRKSIPKNFP